MNRSKFKILAISVIVFAVFATIIYLIYTYFQEKNSKTVIVSRGTTIPNQQLTTQSYPLMTTSQVTAINIQNYNVAGTESTGDKINDIQRFKALSIIKTNSIGTISIKMQSGATYNMTNWGEKFEESVSNANEYLTILIEVTGGATYKFHAIKF